MILDLFKPAWLSANPSRRRKGVLKLNPDITGDADALFSLASQDPEQSVRLAAIERISNLTLLVRLLKNAPTSLEQDKLGRLVTQAVLIETHDQEGINKALELIDMDDDLQHIALESASKEAQTLAVHKILKEEYLLEIAIKHPLSKLRLSAAEKIQSPILLAQLLDKMKGKDKSVWRNAKEKVDAVRSVEQAQAKRRIEADECFAQIQHMQTLDIDPLSKQKWGLLKSRWDAIDAADKAHLDPRNLIDSITTKIQAFDARSAEQAYQVESKADAESEQHQTLILLADALEILKSTETESIDIPSLRATLTTQTSRWHTATEQYPPQPHHKSAFERDSTKLSQAINAIYNLRTHVNAIKEIHEELHQLAPDDIARNSNLFYKTQKLLKRINWPSDVITPKDMQRLNTDFQCLEDRQRRQSELLEKHETAIQQELHKLAEILSSGKLTNAESTLRSIQNAIKKLPEKNAESLRQKLKPLTAQYAELKDWQAFAAQPKKEALILSMEGLAADTTSDVDPSVRLDYIQKLQSEWRELGRLDQPTENELWERFQSASKEAYAPCKAFYEEQANTRERNKLHREKMCSQLQDYLDRYNWSKADWPNVQDTIKLAREEWKRYLPIDRKFHKSLEEEFNQLIQHLNDKLLAHKQTNQRLKQKLLDEAEALKAVEDIDSALEKAKLIREEWRKVGMLPPESYKVMNQAFYDIFNEISARKQKQWQDVTAQKKHNAEQLSIELDQLQALLESGDIRKILAGQQDFQDAEQSFVEFSPLLEQDLKKLRYRFKTLTQLHSQALVKAKADSQKSTVDNLWHRSELLRQLEFKVQTQNLSDHELVQIKDEWNQIPDSNHQIIAVQNARFDAAIHALSSHQLNLLEKANEKADQYAIELCVLMEILAEIDSPEADAELRMQLQVNRLNDSLQNRKGDFWNEFDQLTLEWCSTGPLSRQTSQEFEHRFENARRHYLNKLKCSISDSP